MIQVYTNSDVKYNTQVINVTNFANVISYDNMLLITPHKLLN